MEKLVHHIDYPSDVDGMLVPMLDVLNSIPGCRTLYSCDGHGREPMYVSMGFSSPVPRKMVSDVLSAEIPDVELDMKNQPDGILDYEMYLGAYSFGTGTLPYGRRRRRLADVAKKLLNLVPVNWWTA